MHCHVELWVPDLSEDLEGLVAKELVEFFEDEGRNESGWWDWYQIGGRWKGAHVPDYDPEQDKDHLTACFLCGGSGVRPEMNLDNGCNGCNGTGQRTDWPTRWNMHPKDIIPTSECPNDLTCYRLVLDKNGLNQVYDTPAAVLREILGEDRVMSTEYFDYNRPIGDMLVKTGWDGKVKDTLTRLGITGGYLITLDCHS